MYQLNQYPYGYQYPYVIPYTYGYQHPYVNPYSYGYQHSYVNPYSYGYQHSYLNTHHPTTIPTTSSSSYSTACMRLKAIYAENITKLRGLRYQWDHATSQEEKNAINKRINELEAEQSTIEDEMLYEGCS